MYVWSHDAALTGGCMQAGIEQMVKHPYLDLIEQSWNSSYRDLINVAINTSVSGWLLDLNPYTQASLRQEKEKV